MSAPKIPSLLTIAGLLGVLVSVILGKLPGADLRARRGICLLRACGYRRDLACPHRALDRFHQFRLKKCYVPY